MVRDTCWWRPHWQWRNAAGAVAQPESRGIATSTDRGSKFAAAVFNIILSTTIQQFGSCPCAIVRYQIGVGSDRKKNEEIVRGLL